MPAPLKKTLIIAALLLALILSVAGWIDRGLQWGGLGQLSAANHTYLDGAFEKSLAGFVLLSSIKSGLAVVEGSEVGIGFNLQLGDVVQPAYDYVDIAWRAALAGGTIIVGMQLALKGLALADHWVLAGLLVVLAGRFLAQWIAPHWKGVDLALKEAVRMGITLCLTLYLLLPLSVLAAGGLSSKITGPMIAASHQELKEIKEAISPEQLNTGVMNRMASESLSGASLKERLAAARAGVEKLMIFLKTETDRIAALTLKLIAAYLFDCILFPLLFGLILITMVKSGVSYFFDIGRQPAG